VRTALVVLSILFAPSLAAAEVADVHDTWNALVQRYVVDERWVDYSAWHASEEDLQTLTEVVEAYESGADRHEAWEHPDTLFGGI